jgi:hypothetical protein
MHVKMEAKTAARTKAFLIPVLPSGSCFFDSFSATPGEISANHPGTRVKMSLIPLASYDPAQSPA